MADRLLSVGLDVGTTTTQLVVSAITVENQASGFAVPEMSITDREILYKSPVHFTPLSGHNLVDADGLREWLLQEYAKAGITRQQIDTGAVIITGETSRKENAATVLHALSDFAGDFVVATAGPDLESVLAAKGAGAVAYSEQTGKTVLHIDIGGGTSNLALIQEGRIVRTGCLNVGGRLIKLDEMGRIRYISPVLEPLTSLKPGDTPQKEQLVTLTRILCSALEMAAGKAEPTILLHTLSTEEMFTPWEPPSQPLTVSFSGGVSDCIRENVPDFAFGDLGPLLGKAIRESRLCREDYILGKETIRATVIGAGCHSTQLSGSTVYCRDVYLPKKNMPVISFTEQEQAQADFSGKIAAKLERCDSAEAVLAIPGYENADYGRITELAEKIKAGVGTHPVYVCLQGDMAKALGQRLSLILPPMQPCLCLDRLKFTPESYLDVGLPVGPCYPVVIKTLALSN